MAFVLVSDEWPIGRGDRLKWIRSERLARTNTVFILNLFPRVEWYYRSANKTISGQTHISDWTTFRRTKKNIKIKNVHKMGNKIRVCIKIAMFSVVGSYFINKQFSVVYYPLNSPIFLQLMTPLIYISNAHTVRVSRPGNRKSKFLTSYTCSL